MHDPVFVKVGYEERFQWQKPINDFDAFYNLPSALSQRKTNFGTSTREDWETTVKNKRDGNNPNAGPGNYNCTNFSALSTNSDCSKVKFGLFPRPSMDMKTLSPGPAYDITDQYKNGRESKIKPGFNKDKRKELADNNSSRTDASYYPKLARGKSMSILKRTKSTFEQNFTTKVPGPIYNTHKYFEAPNQKGPQFSFGASRASRFGGPGSAF